MVKQRNMRELAQCAHLLRGHKLRGQCIFLSCLSRSEKSTLRVVDRFSVLRSPRCARAGLGGCRRRSVVCSCIVAACLFRPRDDGTESAQPLRRDTSKVSGSIYGKARRRRILRALLWEDVTVNEAWLQRIDSQKQEQRKALPLLLAALNAVLVLLVQL